MQSRPLRSLTSAVRPWMGAVAVALVSTVAVAGPKKPVRPAAPVTAPASAAPSAPAGPQAHDGLSHVLGFLDWGASSQDVISALKKEIDAKHADLMRELRNDYTIIIVTHNMQQAARVSDMTAFYTTEVTGVSDRRSGVLVEYETTERIFSTPTDERTENYITEIGRASCRERV